MTLVRLPPEMRAVGGRWRGRCSSDGVVVVRNEIVLDEQPDWSLLLLARKKPDDIVLHDIVDDRACRLVGVITMPAPASPDAGVWPCTSEAVERDVVRRRCKTTGSADAGSPVVAPVTIDSPRSTRTLLRPSTPASHRADCERFSPT